MDLLRTCLFNLHLKHKAKMVPFGGWEMPLHYETGIVAEHLSTRKKAGLFDVSHMGRLLIKGRDAVPFLQHTLSNNVEAIEENESLYTFIPTQTGGAVDDAYLYRFETDSYLLVVNASNRTKVLDHFKPLIPSFGRVELEDVTFDMAMLSLQGPDARRIMIESMESGSLPEPLRNSASECIISKTRVLVARTGYTGEPLCFELFFPASDAEKIWNLLVEAGACPTGLGARDTLRLEAGLPLYGHELGTDPDGREIPLFALNLARIAVSFSPLKGEFIGKRALLEQHSALKKILNLDFSEISHLPERIMPVAVTGKGLARAGFPLFKDSVQVGRITSGTMVPYWNEEGRGIFSRFTARHSLRPIALAMIDSRIREYTPLMVDIRGRMTPAFVVPYHLRSEAPPYARPILWNRIHKGIKEPEKDARKARAFSLVKAAIENAEWRRKRCINLIPSEQTPSAVTRMLSISDPCGRYAEHKAVKAFGEYEVFYYQGTDFIARVEEMLQAEIMEFLGCRQVETRVISGQMANTAVFSALVDHLNRADRKSEQRRISKVLNHHIIRGGHLSAQPMGALRDFVARDPVTEKPAVVNFPVVENDPFRIDVEACREILAAHRPELIIFGKSMTIYKEPVIKIRKMVREMGIDAVILYDMAHVLGLVGPYFQQPFEEGADLVTGSTHKTFFGTQRGIIAADYEIETPEYELWEAVLRRTFPGSVSNHHLGTLLGLLMAAFEMNSFKDEYQRRVIENAKAFAAALGENGFKVAGDPDISYTETHQVILEVGYSKGPEIARRLEENGIIVNFQATPEEEGFTASGAIRMGVQEMTRFGMKPPDFKRLAVLMADLVLKKRKIADEVARLREEFLEMKFCFKEEEFAPLMERLYRLL